MEFFNYFLSFSSILILSKIFHEEKTVSWRCLFLLIDIIWRNVWRTRFIWQMLYLNLYCTPKTYEIKSSTFRLPKERQYYHGMWNICASIHINTVKWNYQVVIVITVLVVVEKIYSLSIKSMRKIDLHWSDRF